MIHSFFAQDVQKYLYIYCWRGKEERHAELWAETGKKVTADIDVTTSTYLLHIFADIDVTTSTYLLHIQMQTSLKYRYN